MSTGAKALTDALRVDLPDDFAATDVCMGFVPLTTRSCSGCAMAHACKRSRTLCCYAAKSAANLPHAWC